MSWVRVAAQRRRRWAAPVGVVAGMSAAVWALLVVGCGSPNVPAETKTFTPSPSSSASATAPEEDVARVTVVDAGFSRSDEYGTSVIGYGMVLQNASKTKDALGLTVTVNFLDPSGIIVQTETVTIGVVPAGSHYYLGGTSYPGNKDKTSKMETVIDQGSSEGHRYTFPKTSAVRVSSDFSGSLEVRGVVENPFSQPITVQSWISVVCFDAEKKVVGGGGTTLQADLSPGRKAAFTVPFTQLGGIKRTAVRSVKVTMGNPDLLE